MNETINVHFKNIFSKDLKKQHEAFLILMKRTDTHVDWSYDFWNKIIRGLSDEDNHIRAIMAQLLCNISWKSDDENRILNDFEALLTVTKDERFVTARHAIQNIWKVGLGGSEQLELLLSGLEKRFNECESEKNCTLIRYDILVGLKKLFDISKDESIQGKAFELIEIEKDEKYKNKYQKVWKK